MMSILCVSSPLLPSQDDPLWSARFLHTNPNVIREIHESYLNHGADIIITSSYQVLLILCTVILPTQNLLNLFLIDFFAQYRAIILGCTPNHFAYCIFFTCVHVDQFVHHIAGNFGER